MAVVADEALDVQLFKRQPDTKRGIPEAIFIENVEALCKNRSSAEVVARLQELHTKYQYMQSSISAQRASLRVKLPDIGSALETVNHLIDRRDNGSGEENYTYQLAENIWAKASAEKTNCVCLWLGANVMLEYTLEEARDLLTTNETNAKTLLKSLDEDVAFLRDQITTTEVNIARTHNYGVKVRQQAKDEGKDTPAVPVSAPKSFAPAPRADEGAGMTGGPDYKWKQDKEELEIWVPVPEAAKKTDVKVTILQESVKVEHAGKVLLQGRLAGKCSPNGSTWTLGANRVEISLEKAEAAQWPSLFEVAEA